MREKELRLALICYGGISLAVYMHGISKEIWRLARASRAFHDGDVPARGSERVYHQLLETIAAETGLKLRVLVDIVAGASAGGINGVFLGQAIATGQSLDPLTDLWLERADVEVLLDPEAKASRLSKMWATPIAWWAAGRPGGTLEQTVEEEGRDEVRAKLSAFVRGRWFEPPFGGPGFCNLLLDALDAMAATSAGPPLLPAGQPLDVFVTATDFHGYPERLSLHSPAEILETEHRLVMSFSDHGIEPRDLGDTADLVFAARATASFPGAFPPFSVPELDAVLAAREQGWPRRDAFLQRVLPRHCAIGSPDRAVLIDGSVLANAPFRPAIEALRDRPARREIDRRFVYIDPKPGRHSVRLGGKGGDDLPGFFTTIFGALSDIPREQPIRDNLEAIAARSARVNRMQSIVETIRPEVEAAIEGLFGRTFFLDSPTPARLRTWRARAQDAAAKRAGFAYASYGHLKMATVVDELAESLRLIAGDDHRTGAALRGALWDHVRQSGLVGPGSLSASGASETVILFFRNHDLGFRIRRLRTVARRIAALEQQADAPREPLRAMADAVWQALAPYLDRQTDDFYGPSAAAAARGARQAPEIALERLAEARNLRMVDDHADELIAAALSALPKPERRALLLAYLGYPFDDIATLPLLHGEGDDEFNAIKVDRISPDDACAIREGGAEATLKGIQFNSFGAFFSRAYRENDYLWGRLHGADRLIDIVVSTLPAGATLRPGVVARLKKRAFRGIIADERKRLSAIPALFDTLEREVG